MSTSDDLLEDDADPDLQLLAAAMRHRLPVLLVGETGTGKSRLARRLHHLLTHPRRRRPDPGPFVDVNMATIPEALAEAELFGCHAGAYTGAVTRLGQFHRADGGTLFLDELHRMPASAQAKLLLALEPVRPTAGAGRGRPQADARLARRLDADSSQGTYWVVPLGAPGVRKGKGAEALVTRLADPIVRTALVCATTSPERIEPEILHRVSGLTHRLLPLREERPAIADRATGFLIEAVLDGIRRQAAEAGVSGPAARQLVQRAAGMLDDRRRGGSLLSPDARTWLVDERRRWPGNNRQLRALVTRAQLLAPGGARAGDAPFLTAALLEHASSFDIVGAEAPRPDLAASPRPDVAASPEVPEDAAAWLDRLDHVDLVGLVGSDGRPLHLETLRERIARALARQVSARGVTGQISARKVVDAFGLRARAEDLLASYPELAAVLAPIRRRPKGGAEV